MTPSPSHPSPTRRSTKEVLDMIDDVLPQGNNPQPDDATPGTPVPFSPNSPTGPR